MIGWLMKSKENRRSKFVIPAIDLQFPTYLKCYDMIFRSSASLATGCEGALTLSLIPLDI
jgi:hypothetical protein